MLLFINVRHQNLIVSLCFQAGDKAIAYSHDSVVILFCDIVGFTPLSMKSNPSEIFKMLNTLFMRFDGVTDIFSVYKVETIGDAYMIAAGMVSF